MVHMLFYESLSMLKYLNPANQENEKFDHWKDMPHESISYKISRCIKV